jgi:DNA-binding NarL/FixJ family response regulator
MTEEYQISEAFKKVVSRERNFQFIDFNSHSGDNVLAAAKFLENFYPDAVLMLCRIHHPTTAFVSKNCKHILGHTHTRIMGLSLEEVFALVHPDDARSVRMCYTRMEKEMNSKNYRPDNFRFAIHYRWKTAEGEYICIRDEKHAFLYEGEVYIHYSIVRQIEERDFRCFLTIYKKNSNSFRKIADYMPQAHDKQLTAREREILQCINVGMRTKQIAENLYISTNTVRNHRHNLLKKTASKSIIQALRAAKAYGWLA